jgi:hypothetical protein
MKNKFIYILSYVVILMVSALSAYAQNPVSGIVVDKSGSPIPGALVSAKGTDLTALTGVDGTFSLDVPYYVSKLVFRYGGYGKVSKPADQGMEVTMRKSSGVSSDNFFASFQIAVPNVTQARPAFGFMAGWCGGFGGYMKGVFRGDGDIDSRRYSEGYTDGLWLTGDNVATYNSITWGGMMRLYSPVYAYAGLGCAWRKVFYELAGGDWICSRIDSYTNFALDLGLMFKYQSIMFNAGMIWMPGYSCAGNFGIGYCF